MPAATDRPASARSPLNRSGACGAGTPASGDPQLCSAQGDAMSTAPTPLDEPLENKDAAPDAPRTERDLPLVAYVLLWFPLSSETFIFREVQRLLGLGLPVRVYTMYGRKLAGCSDEMKKDDLPVVRFGLAATLRVLGAFFRALCRNPRGVWKLMREGLFRRMRNAEALCENTWCFLAGFLLAEEAMRDGVQLLHSSWGNGPATAAWIASRLTGIPFAFTGRAGDIYPQDGILAEKSRDALFIRTNNMANVDYLRQFCAPEAQDKVHCVYNGLTLGNPVECEMPFVAPYRLLAVGRFCRTKGFVELMAMMARLRREGFPVQLTLVGDGEWRGRLRALRHRLGLDQVVDMPGFVPHDHIRDYMHSHDILVVPSVIHTNGDRDGIPNVIMEALSCRMPVVATDVCGIREVIETGETGILVPQRNPAALARAVRRLLTDRTLARRMAENGQKRVQRMFDSQANIQALLDLYLKYYNDWHASRPEEWFSLGGKLPVSEDAPRS